MSFLEDLSQLERLKVSNINRLIYRAVIMEKEGGAAPLLVGADEAVLRLLRRLEIKELERLSKSVRLTSEANEICRYSPSEAAAKYQDAIEANPFNEIALVSYGVMLALQGDLGGRISCVEKALEVNPESDRARQNLRSMKADLESRGFVQPATRESKYPDWNDVRDDLSLLHPLLLRELKKSMCFIVLEEEKEHAAMIVRVSKYEFRGPVSAATPMRLHIDFYSGKQADIFTLYPVIYDDPKDPFFKETWIEPYDDLPDLHGPDLLQAEARK